MTSTVANRNLINGIGMSWPALPDKCEATMKKEKLNQLYCMKGYKVKHKAVIYKHKTQGPPTCVTVYVHWTSGLSKLQRT